jgi:Chalcone isomerase-like
MSAAERAFGPRAAAILALLGLLAAHSAPAAVCRGVDFPQTIEVRGTPLSLNGLGIRKATFLRVQVYVAALYLPAEARGSDARAIVASPGPMELVLHFVRGVGASDIRNAFREGFAAQGGGTVPAALASRVALLNSWIREMRSGDSMTFVRIPGHGVELDLDGHRVLGAVPGDDFAQALFAIWLGEHPPNAELKSGLLGGPCS